MQKEYYALKFIIGHLNNTYAIKIEKNIAEKCLYIRTMINSNMIESGRIKENKIINIKFKTTKYAVKEYFGWLSGVIKKPTKTETLLLAHYFMDENFELSYIHDPIDIFYNMYKAQLNELPEKIVLHYCEEYINLCFNNMNLYYKQIKKFIKQYPVLAKYIWDNCPDLISLIKTPDEYVEKLSKLDFIDLPEFLINIIDIQDKKIKYKDFSKIIMICI